MRNGQETSEFASLLADRDHGWTDLRQRLTRAARDLHFAGIDSHSREGAALLAIATGLAELAMSIPPHGSRRLGGPVKASTLFATQVFQRAQAGISHVAAND